MVRCNMKTSIKLGLVLILCYLVAWLDRMAIALTLPAMEKDLHLNAQTSGYVISAFFVGYALCQVPGGMLADKFGPRRVIIVALAWWSTFTALTGLAWSLHSMIAIRFLFGLGEGVFPAAVWKILSQWFTKKNRATANSLVLSSIAIGPALTPFVLVPLIGTIGWRNAYLCIGLLGIVCVLLAWRYAYNSIHEGRGVTSTEIAQFAEDSRSAIANAEATGGQTRFADVLRTPLVWVLFSLGVIGNIGLYGWLQWLPTFFKKTHHLAGTKFMFASAVPWIAASIGLMLSGVISDRWFRGRRKLLVLCGQLAGIAGLWGFTRVQGSDLPVAMAFQCLAGFAFFMAVGAIWSLPINLLPAKLMGSASGLINTGGQIGGVLSGIVIGFYVELSHKDYSRMWDVVLVTAAINAAVIVFGIHERKRARAQTRLMAEAL
jgi:sugar phosphate permease